MQQHQYQQPSLSQSQSQIQQYQNHEEGLPSTLPLISQGLIKVDIQTYFQQYENLLAGFQSNIDLRLIPSKKGNSVLLTKAGAEKICRFLGLNYRLISEQPYLDFNNNIFHYSYECQLYSNENLIGNGYGNCNNRESKYKNAYSPDILNTIDKMAQKRAFIQAVLLSTGGSRYFRQLTN
jgi:hypothetical protein